MYLFFKRLSDLVVSIFACFMLTPLFFFIALSIKLSFDNGPIFYKGERAAKGGGSFYLYKFRTMVSNAESIGGPSTAVDDPRFSKIGRFLRKYKLDEIPQFYNVLLGEMSLVGPRPQVLFYTDQYNEEESLMLSVKPGLTDLATIEFSDMDLILGSGNVDEKYSKEIEPKKNKLRIKYVKEMSFKLDIYILARTAMKVLRIRTFDN